MCQLCNLVNLANRRQVKAAPPTTLSSWGALSQAVPLSNSPSLALKEDNRHGSRP
jgi:hypothetical protein